jgi:rhamnulokinase
MSNLYVACELGAETGRIMLGALQRDGLMVSEAGDVQNLTVGQDEASQWDVSSIYQQVLGAARGIAAQEEPVRGISFHTSVSDCLLFEGNGALVAPATRAVEAAATAQLSKVLSKIPLAEFFEETGIQPTAQSMLCQLGAESSRRLRRATYALSLADAFNFLLSGVPRAEVSQASQTHLYNPLTKSWSERFLKIAGLSPKLLPPVIKAGTKLGDVRADISREAGLEDARVIATCSHQTAAALAALTIADAGDWAYLCPDDWTLLGTQLQEPFINEISREMKYSNLMGYGHSVGFQKRWVGLWLVVECRRAWVQQDRAMDSEVLMHLATSATPFEALIDPSDPRFLTAEDMPQAIQAYCRETGQDAPRKPGPILRCVLESLALQYRKGLLELEYISGRSLSRLYVLGGRSNLLFNHFLANALQIPVVVLPSETASVGNVALQALTLGHIPSLDHARELVRRALKTQTINPHAAAWTEAYDRFLSLGISPEEPQDGDVTSP